MIKKIFALHFLSPFGKELKLKLELTPYIPLKAMVNMNLLCASAQSFEHEALHKLVKSSTTLYTSPGKFTLLMSI